MWLFLLLAAIPVGRAALDVVSLNSLCRQDALIQLGHFSPYFVECRGRTGFVRMCPVRGEIFAHGVCQPAGKEAHDTSVSLLNEETSDMAEQEQFCGAGGLSGIYTSREACSRQALLCSGVTVVAIACPNGQVLRSDLSCGNPGPQCYGQQSTPIREFFLQRLCYPPTKAAQQYQQEKCATWYVNCHPRPSVVRCPSGSVFDRSTQQCRPWRQGDACQMSGSCTGREYQSVSLGECQSVYYYCDGLHGKHLYCSQGMVFNGRFCVPPETAICPVCRQGDTRDGSTCNQYYHCEGNNWVTKSCPQGTGWNQERRQCEASYSCVSPTACQYGSVVSIDCGKALVCNGHGFDEITCPPNTMFDKFEKKCVYHESCNSHTCREGDVILSPDCSTYRLCQNGRYSLYQCRHKSGQLSDYCRSCGQQPSAPGYQPSYPAQCTEGSLQADETNCNSYYRCSNGQWTVQTCPNGEVWSNQWSKCVAARYGDGCSVALEPQCQEGERLYSPTDNDCRHLLECKAARWIEMVCPPGYYYDTTRRSCSPGSCPSNPTPEIIPGPAEPSLPPAPPPADDGYGIFCTEGERAADLYDCSKYMACKNGQMVTEYCPPGSGYHAVDRQCKQGYRCGADCHEGVVIPMATCGHYKVCVQGKYREGKCNLNKMFIHGRCVDKDCQPIYFFPDCQEGSVRPPSSQSDPSIYMVCSNGHWQERNCGPTAVFNYQTQICEIQVAPLLPPTCYGGETRPISGSCHDYEACEYGNWKRQRCPHGQKFTNGYCVPGDCQERCREAADAYRRDSYDCSKYYQCVHGNWMQRPCAPGTVFNERVLVCDHQGNVPECG